MNPGQPDTTIVRRHLLALDEAVQHLRRHTGRPFSLLVTNPDERWTVERGLQLCAQNALDVHAAKANSGLHATWLHRAGGGRAGVTVGGLTGLPPSTAGWPGTVTPRRALLVGASSLRPDPGGNAL
jgi:hypothetical protein